jgi:hypothetical protein
MQKRRETVEHGEQLEESTNCGLIRRISERCVHDWELIG